MGNQLRELRMELVDRGDRDAANQVVHGVTGIETEKGLGMEMGRGCALCDVVSCDVV